MTEGELEKYGNDVRSIQVKIHNMVLADRILNDRDIIEPSRISLGFVVSIGVMFAQI